MLSSKNWIKVKNRLGTQLLVLHHREIRKRGGSSKGDGRGAVEVEGKPGTWSPRSKVKEFVAEGCSFKIRIGS